VDELFRARRLTAPPARFVAAVVPAGATSFLLLGTCYFTTLYRGPAIFRRLPA